MSMYVLIILTIQPHSLSIATVTSQFAKSGVMDPFTDAAFFISRLLFQVRILNTLTILYLLYLLSHLLSQHFPMRSTVDDINQAELIRKSGKFERTAATFKLHTRQLWLVAY